MKVEKTSLDGVLRILPRRFGDHRGFFAETYNRRAFEALGIATEFVQDNQSLSSAPNTLRGLHFQAPPHAQDKLVRCGAGALFDVAVDLRAGSPTYGQWYGETLSAENGLQLFIPKGFAHGFVTCVPDTEIIYKCSDFYAPEADGSLLWSDFGIDWPLTNDPVLSDKDANALRFHDFDTPFKDIR